jgi:cobalt-zinc-cadmium efflux system outer membrane protein
MGAGLAFGPVLPARAQAPAQPPLTLTEALARARARNPAIVAARLAEPVASANVAVARERPNPDFTYEASRDTPRQAFGGSLPIELGGKRGRRIDVATAGVARTVAELDQTTADVEAQVQKAYVALAAAQTRVTTAADLRALAERARDAAQARFTSGDAPRLEAVQTELALAAAENELSAAQGEAAAARVALDVLLGEAPDAPLTVATDVRLVRLPSLADALAAATHSNRDLVVIDRQIAEQVARVSLARAMRTPDASIGSAVTWDAEPEFRVGWRVDFGVTLPVFTAHRAGVLVENAELDRLRASRAATVATLTGTLASALTRAGAAADQWSRYTTDVLPRATDVEQMAQDGYAAGQTDLATLLQVLQSAREARQQGLQIALDYQNALAELEHAMGTPITP